MSIRWLLIEKLTYQRATLNERYFLSVINYRIISYSYRTEREMQVIRDKIDRVTQGMLSDL